MSFLNRSKASIQESPSMYNSRVENDRTFTQSSNISRSKEDIMGNLQAFRSDIRKQISDKISKNFKILDVSSPKATPDLKTLLSTKNAGTTTPLKASLYNDRETSFSTTKAASQKKFDLSKDFSKRGERSSPYKEKQSELLAQLNKLHTEQRLSVGVNSVNSIIKRSPEKKTASPKKRENSLDLKPLDYFKKDKNSKSYIEQQPRSSLLVEKKQDYQSEIKNILDHGKSIKNKREAFNTEADYDRRNPGLSSKVSQLRSSQIGTSTPNLLSGFENTSVSRNYSSIDNYRSVDNYKSVDSLRREIATAEDRREERDQPSRRRVLELKSMNIFSPTSMVGTTQDSFSQLRHESGVSNREALISDQIPYSKLYELQDTFYSASDKGFDQLSADYVEELIKLSSIIMHRVKNSSYYNKT